MNTNTWRGIDPVEFGLECIVIDPEICSGQPTVKGTRIMVMAVLQAVLDGRIYRDDYLESWITQNAYPSLTSNDVIECFLFTMYLCELGDDSLE